MKEARFGKRKLIITKIQEAYNKCKSGFATELS